MSANTLLHDKQKSKRLGPRKKGRKPGSLPPNLENLGSKCVSFIVDLTVMTFYIWKGREKAENVLHVQRSWVIGHTITLSGGNGAVAGFNSHRSACFCQVLARYC